MMKSIKKKRHIYPLRENGEYIMGILRGSRGDLDRYKKRIDKKELEKSIDDREFAEKIFVLTPEIDRYQRPAIPAFVNLEKILSKAIKSQQQLIVIILRNGLFGYPDCTLRETGKHIGVTQERVRQIEAKAMRKLRHWFASNAKMTGYWEYRDHC